MSLRTPAILTSIGLLALLAAVWPVHRVAALGRAAPAAQETATPAAAPQPTAVNLSRSGAVSQFRFVIDTTRLTHIIWEEAGVEAFYYTQGNGDQWSAPLPVELPFGSAAYVPDLGENDPTPLFLPQFAATADGRVHAFWLDGEARLRHSSAPAESFADFGAWEAPQDLAEQVLALDVAVGAGDRLHVLYISALHTADSPAGVYHRSAPTGSDAWSAALPLYTSSYLRTITPEQANVRVAVGNGETVLAAWDNPLPEKVFTARSADGGQTWAPALEVDGREPTDVPGAAGPARIDLSAAGEAVLLLWQAGHDGLICSHYFMASSDGGAGWGPRTRMPAPNNVAPGCATNSQFLAGDDLPILLLRTGADGAHLLAWNGSVQAETSGAWSDPIARPALAQFANPDTNQNVNLGCHQAQRTGAQLVVVGCNEGGVADIWYLRDDFGAFDDWFPEPSIWSDLTTAVIPGASAANASSIHNLNLLADAQNRLHLFWSDDQAVAVKYAFSDAAGGSAWSQSLSAPQSPGGMARDPHVTLSPDNRLLAVWSDPAAGAIYFSEAAAADAASSGSWSSPIAVVEASSPPVSPQIVLAPDGTFYTTFAIPFNEGRGVYLARSDDRGRSWSEATLVYDGQVDNQTSVDQPNLLVAENGELHLVWRLRPLLQHEEIVTVLYARSSDGGQAWSAPQTMVQAPVIWTRIVESGGLYLIWQQQADNALSLQFQTSTDGGRSWDHPGILASLPGATVVPVAIAVDAHGAHLLQRSDKRLQHWITNTTGDGESAWVVADEFNMTDTVFPEGGVLAVASRGDNRLFAALTVLEISAPASTAEVKSTSGEEVTSQQLAIRITDRLLDNVVASAQPVFSVTAIPTEAAVITATATVEPAPAPSPTSTIGFPTDLQTPGNGIPFLDTNNRWLRLGLALVPTLFVVVAVLLVRAAIVHRR